jgi:hypothetical protein
MTIGRWDRSGFITDRYSHRLGMGRDNLLKAEEALTSSNPDFHHVDFVQRGK